MKTHQPSRTRRLKQATLVGLGTANSSPNVRTSTSLKKRAIELESEGSDGVDGLPVIKLQSKARLEERSSNSNHKQAPLHQLSRKRRKALAETHSSGSQSAISKDKNNNSTPPRRTQTRRLTKGRRAQDSSEDEEMMGPKRVGNDIKRLTEPESDNEDNIVNEVEKDRENSFFPLPVRPTISIKVSLHTVFVRGTRRLLSKKAWKS